MTETVNFADLLAAAKANPIVKTFPDGTHRVVLDSAEWGLTSTGKWKIKFRLKCIDENSPSFGKAFTWNLTLSTEKPAFFLKRLETLGADAEFLSTAPSENDVLRKIMQSGCEYLVTVKNGTYLGRETIDVVSLRRA